MLGIYSRYCLHEATEVALRFADWAAAATLDVKLKALESRPMQLGLRWDSDVRRNKSQQFTDWARNCRAVVWTHIPSVGQITWCRRQGIKTYVVCLWHEMSQDSKASLREADKVLVFSSLLGERLRNMGVPRITAVQWAPDLPVTVKDPRAVSNYRRLMLPLYGRDPWRMEFTVLDVLGRTLQEFKDTTLTALYSSSSVLPSAKRRLQSFKKNFPDRVTLLKGVPFKDRAHVFQEHDLTVWAGHYDNFGATALTSLYMGTPVIHFKIPPLAEFLTKHNSIPVTCQYRYDGDGKPQSDPDYDLFTRALFKALSDRCVLPRLNASVSTGLVERQDVFRRDMTRLFVSDP